MLRLAHRAFNGKAVGSTPVYPSRIVSVLLKILLHNQYLSPQRYIKMGTSDFGPVRETANKNARGNRGLVLD